MAVSEDKRLELMVDAWKMTVETQRHFNDVAMKIRHFGFVILAAVIGAAGLSLRSNFSIELCAYNIPIGAFIMLFGSLVWMGIFFLDTKWYSPFLLGAVRTGMQIEEALNKELPGCFTHSTDIKNESNKVTLFGIKVDSKKRGNIFHFSMIAVLLILTILMLFTATPVAH